MKRTLLTTLITIITISLAFSQDTDRKGYIGISLGPSIPLGDYASKNAEKDGSGFAKTGAMLDINFGYRLAKSFGVTALLRGQSNNVDAQQMADYITGMNVNSQVKSDAWSLGAFMGGVYGTFPLSNSKTSFEVRGLVGYVSATSPKLRIDVQTSEGSGWVEQESRDADAFAYMFGAGFRFNVSQKISLVANADYFSTKPEFQNVTLTVSDGSYTKVTDSQKMESFNVSFGVAYRIK